MMNAIMAEVNSDKMLVIEPYGHFGVFVLPPHIVIKRLKRKDYPAHIFLNISVKDCLYFDTGVAPRKVDSQQFEASQFFVLPSKN